MDSEGQEQFKGQQSQFDKQVDTLLTQAHDLQLAIDRLKIKLQLKNKAIVDLKIINGN